nr:hypothetical protein [uncultured Lichenicoccus sp.]
MSAAADSITILHAPGSRLAKTITPTHIFAYGGAKRFHMYSVDLPDMDRLHRLLVDLLEWSDCAIVRGAPVDPERVVRVRRLLHLDPVTGDAPTLIDVPRRWLALDMDGVGRPEHVSAADLEACGRLAIATLPPEFQGVQCIVAASASHGLKPGCRLRLWFLLSRPTSGAELKRWLAGTPADPAVFGAAQLIYSAAPVFQGDLVDHLPQRVVILAGSPVVAVPSPEALAPPPAPPVVPFTAMQARHDQDYVADQVETKIRNAIAAVSMAGEGGRHSALLKQSRLLGGLQHLDGFADESAVDWLLAALPTDADKRSSRAAVLYGLAAGRQAPIDIPPDWRVPREFAAMCDRLVENMSARRAAQS